MTWGSRGPCFVAEMSDQIVPTPALDDAGRACWVLDGRFKCPIGYLTTSFQSFGMLDSAIAAP
jgi:hypothetical protein